MKRLLTILFTFFVLISAGQNEHFIDSVFVTSKAYKSRFIPDGGTMLSDRLTKAYMLMAEKHGIADNIEFGWMSGGASKKRTNGIYQHYTNLYDFYGTNDATQTTEANQPYVSGNIAPNEVECLKNPNGDSRYVTHPEISFASTDEWSVTTVINHYASNVLSYFGSQYLQDLSGESRVSFYDLFTPLYEIKVRGAAGQTAIFNTYDTREMIGKSTIIEIVFDGSSLLYLYVNGVSRGSVSFTNAFNFYRLFSSNYGTISAHIIRSSALTADQVAAEHALLREIYPEIPSVAIGGYTFATTSLEMVASTNGTVITEATDNTDWATGAARWCYHTNTATGAVYNKLYNKAARDVIIANPPEGWHVATEAELTALALYGGNSLKVPGTDYWTTTGGTNTTGFSAIGSSSRNADGTFNTIKNTASFWCADSDKVLTINHDSNTATVGAVTSANEGHSIRLVKD